jgi:hypothetical protein
LKLKYHVPLKDVKKISCSTQGDGAVVFHVDRVEKDQAHKGDYLFLAEHLIELVTRLAMAYRLNEGRDLEVSVSDAFMVHVDAKGGTRISFDKAQAASVRNVVRSHRISHL